MNWKIHVLYLGEITPEKVGEFLQAAQVK